MVGFVRESFICGEMSWDERCLDKERRRAKHGRFIELQEKQSAHYWSNPWYDEF
jgi:hypothetical protein